MPMAQLHGTAHGMVAWHGTVCGAAHGVVSCAVHGTARGGPKDGSRKQALGSRGVPTRQVQGWAHGIGLSEGCRLCLIRAVPFWLCRVLHLINNDYGQCASRTEPGRSSKDQQVLEVAVDANRGNGSNQR